MNHVFLLSYITTLCSAVLRFVQPSPRSPPHPHAHALAHAWHVTETHHHGDNTTSTTPPPGVTEGGREVCNDLLLVSPSQP